MKIWAMNLKDNRNNGENKSLEVKFLACKEHKPVGNWLGG